MGGVYCPSCEAAVEPATKFCLSCGNDLTVRGPITATGHDLNQLKDVIRSREDLSMAEKFDMIAEAVNNSGVEFESLNRRYKSIIASAAGFDNVAEFQRQLLGEEAVDEAKAAVDTGPLTTENLAERAKQGMDMQEKSKASVSSFGVAAVKAYEAASGAADEYNKVVKTSNTI